MVIDISPLFVLPVNLVLTICTWQSTWNQHGVNALPAVIVFSTNIEACEINCDNILSCAWISLRKLNAHLLMNCGFSHLYPQLDSFFFHLLCFMGCINHKMVLQWRKNSFSPLSCSETLTLNYTDRDQCHDQ